MLDLVIDTNVVLDWLAFRNPIGRPLEAALMSRQCRWLCNEAMRDELARVLVRDSLARWAIDASTVLAVFDALGMDVGPAPPLGGAERLHCSDPDDQMFIDLAIARRAHALLTRDRAVLRLASRARRFGVLIVTPEAWLRLRQPVGLDNEVDRQAVHGSLAPVDGSFPMSAASGRQDSARRPLGARTGSE